jgi:hypothetical protein
MIFEIDLTICIWALHFYASETFYLELKISKVHLTTTLSLLGLSDRKISRLEFYHYFYAKNKLRRI